MTSQIELIAPPQRPDSAPMVGSIGMIAVPAASGVGAVLLAVTQRDRPLLAAAGLLVLAASIVVGVLMAVGTRTGTRRRLRTSRERYLEYLELRRHDAVRSRGQQQNDSSTTHPDPEGLESWARQPLRHWRRRPGDPDFMTVRVGLGTVPMTSPVVLRFAPHDPLVEYDQVCVDAALELSRQYTVLDDQPVCLPLTAGPVSIIGPTNEVRAVARAMIAQLAAAHSPAEVALLIWSPDGPAPWEWVKWLPHARSSYRFDGPLPARLIATDLVEALVLADEVANDRKTQLVVILDRLGSPPTPDAAVDDLLARLTTLPTHQVHLVERRSAEPPATSARITLDNSNEAPERREKPATVEFLGTAPTMIECRLDHLAVSAAEPVARAFAPLSPPRDNTSVQPTRDAMLSIGDPTAVDPARSWQNQDADLLRAPIGVDPDGTTVLLDLKEAAHGGIGPHGLIVGATGSGKSELLRTLVLALAIRHSPLRMALLLVDFKGGATFSGLSTLPHVAGTVTNLQHDLTMVDRFRQALAGELLRRQELLAAAGLTSVEEYAAPRGGHPDREPMPRLLVIVDEFSELLGAKPELADLFVTVGRIGRSIGIHLLLATQRLDAGRLRGLESHLSYRICLRTFSESESREAIGTGDAYHLGREPGAAYLRAAGPELRRFQVALVSRSFRPARTNVPSAWVLPYPALNGLPGRAAMLRARAGGGPSGTAVDAGNDRPGSEKVLTALQIAVARLTAGAALLPTGRPARRIWLDPLPARLGWSELPAARTISGAVAQPPAEEQISAAFGVIDVPERQAQLPLTWDCTHGNAHLLVLGAGRSGKSTAVRALLTALCHRYPPGGMAIYCVDYGGESLLPIRDVPHVAVVATRSEPELTRKVFSRITAMLDERAALFRRERLGGVAALRQARRSGRLAPVIPADVLLVVDGWSAVLEGDPNLDATLDEILTRGSGLGVHVILTAAGPARLRTRLLAGFGQRIELRLSDPFDSAVDRRLAADLPDGVPGRALVGGGHYAQVVLPDSNVDFLVEPGSPDGWAAGPAVPRLRALPDRIDLADLLTAAPDEPGMALNAVAAAPRPLWLGLADADLAPVALHRRDSDPHLVIYGDSRSGKSTLLRALLTQLADDAGTYVIDYRRSLTGHPARSRTAVDPAGAAALCAAIAAELAARQTAPDPADAGTIQLLVDNYELLSGPAAGPGGNPLLQLLPFLARAGDLRFHLVVARSSGGAGRARYEPVLQALTDLGGPVLLFSGSAAEGRLAHDTAPTVLPAGRARLATRSVAAQLIQTPLVPGQPW